MSKTKKTIQLKAITLTAMNAIVSDLDAARLGAAMHSLLGNSDNYFAGELAVIDCSQLTDPPAHADWAALSALLARYGLQAIAVKNAPETLQETIRAAGLACLTKPTASPTLEPVAALAPTLPPSAAPTATRIIDRPVRSGQQIYAPGGDLILLNGVSPGAEVIADGNIHCYGPLRGRAVAGAQGNTAARIFCSNFGAELISIAGFYRHFAAGIEPGLAAKPAQAQLRRSLPAPPASNTATAPDSGVDSETYTLIIEPLQLD